MTEPMAREPATRPDPELWWSPTMGAIRKYADHFRVFGGGTGNYWGSFVHADWPADAVQLVLANPAQACIDAALQLIHVFTATGPQFLSPDETRAVRAALVGDQQ